MTSRGRSEKESGDRGKRVLKKKKKEQEDVGHHNSIHVTKARVASQKERAPIAVNRLG